MRTMDLAYGIGQVARESGVTVEALRYYERLGLLHKPARTDSGMRRYGYEAVARVRFIKQAQSLGLSLREIRELVGDSARRTATGCQRVHDLLTRHLDDLERQMADLRRLRSVLRQYRKDCEVALNRESTPTCPTLDTLARPRR